MQSYPTPYTIVRIERMNDSFTKYHLSSGCLLHHFTAATDTEYHDHPFGFSTSILSGGYVEKIGEILPDGTLAIATMKRLPNTTHNVEAGTIHKLIGLLGLDCWSLVMPGRKERDSGFYKVDGEGVWHRYWYERKWKLISPTVL